MSQDYRHSASWYSIRVMTGIFWLLLALIWVPQLWGVRITDIYALGSGAMAVMVLIAVMGVSVRNIPREGFSEDAPDEESILILNNAWRGIQYKSLVFGTRHVMITPGGPVRGRTLKRMARGRAGTRIYRLEDLTSISLTKRLTESRMVMQFGDESAELSFPRRHYSGVLSEIKGTPILSEKVVAA